MGGRGKFHKAIPLAVFIALPAAQMLHAETKAARPGPCRVKPANYEGWRAQQMSNDWVTLTFVPQLGGRLMQVAFAGHAFLFVNPRYLGKYLPPSEGATKGQWFNYGGDKLWPLPEGNQDEQHWPGPLSDVLDDGEYAFHVISQGPDCAVRLEGPADPRTGLQYSREVRIGSESPEISFHAVMKNVSGHTIQWSMQSVTQYDTKAPDNSGDFNHEFWAFTPANAHSTFPGQYRVYSGLPDDPSFAVKDGLFTLHWADLQSEVWVDSPGDWVAVVDGKTSFAMVERFSFTKTADYPGDASVIFYKNGAPPERKKAGGAAGAAADPDDKLFYMEAELNSPLVRLQPGETYAMDTKWFPTRIQGKFKTVADAGLVSQPLEITHDAGDAVLSGTFGVFFAGKLVAYLYGEHGADAGSVSLPLAVSPKDAVTLRETLKLPSSVTRISLHLIDAEGKDRGSLGETLIASPGGGS